MVTNVTTPLWRCDVCGNTHGERLDLAELCESAPLPPQLDDGTPMLVVRRGATPAHPDSFGLRTLSGTGKVETVVTTWQAARSGHHHTYQVDPESGDTRDESNRRNVYTISGSNLHPARPGYLQVSIGDHGRLHVHGDAGEALPDEAILGLGLGQPGSPISAGRLPVTPSWNTTSTWVRPITEPVRAVYDLLGVRIEQLRLSASVAERNRLNYVLHRCGGDLAKAGVVLACTDPAAIDADVADLQARWFAGEDVEAPIPYLDATSTMTASKITKATRPLIEATGVAWEPRTNAADYARTLTRSIAVTEKSFNRGFGQARIVAVGGVKGGVGKTTVAVGLATALARSGRKVVLVDLDLEGPNVHLALGLDDKVALSPDLSRLAPEHVEENLSAFSHGQLGHASLPDRWTQAASTAWIGFLGGALDVDGADIVVLDLPAGLGAVAETVLGSHSSARADVLVSVTTPDPFSLADTAAGLKIQMHEHREQVVVENRARVVGVTAGGEVVEVRPDGPAGQVEALAARARATYGGSMPYAATRSTLADSPEMLALAEMVADIPA